MSTVTAASRRASVWSVVAYNILAARAFWVSVLVVGVLTPLLYVLALGVGLGTVVDHRGTPLGVKYLVFVAPAFSPRPPCRSRRVTRASR